MLQCFGSNNSYYNKEVDIEIKYDCNKNEESSARIGYCYSLPQGVKENSDESKRYLAGSEKFKIKEIEVYKVTIN